MNPKFTTAVTLFLSVLVAFSLFLLMKHTFIPGKLEAGGWNNQGYGWIDQAQWLTPECRAFGDSTLAISARQGQDLESVARRCIGASRVWAFIGGIGLLLATAILFIFRRRAPKNLKSLGDRD